MASQIHEITRGPARGKSLDQPGALLHLCQRCHDYSHKNPSVLRDLAAKKLANDGTYDLKLINQLRNRSMVAIEEWEVDTYIGYFK